MKTNMKLMSTINKATPVVVMFFILFLVCPARAATQNITITGRVTAISGGASPATILIKAAKKNYRVTVTKQTNVVGPTNPGASFTSAAATFEMLSVNDNVQIIATKDATTYTATTIRLTNWGWDGRVTKLNGVITSARCTGVDNGTLNVRINGVLRTATIQSNTIVRRSGTRVNCSDIQSGESAVLMGLYASSGKFVVHRILLPEVVITGTIRSITTRNTGLKILLRLANKRNVTILTTYTTQFQATNFSVASSGVLNTNDKIVVRGVKKPNGSYIAATIRDKTVKAMTTGHIVAKLSLGSSTASSAGSVRAASTVTGSAVISGWGDAIDADNTYAYVVGTTGLQIVDIQKPASPTIVGRYVNGNRMTTIKVSGNYAYIHDETGLSVVDISTPTNPTLHGFVANELFQEEALYDKSGKLTGTVKHPYAPRYVELSGNIVAVAGPTSARPEELTLFDISDPANPAIASAVNISKYYAPFAINGSYLYTYAGGYDRDYNYVDNGREGFWIYDISDVRKPTLVSTDTSLLDGYEFMPVTRFDGSYAYTMGNDIRSYSVLNGTTYTRLDRLDQRISNMTVYGKHLYALTTPYYSQLPQVLDIDITDPFHLRLLGSFSDPSFLVAPDNNNEGGAAIAGIAANDDGIVLLRPADLPPALNGDVRTPAMLITMKFEE